MQTTDGAVNPAPVIEALFGGWVAGLLKGSVDLNVFGAIIKGARSAPAIAEAISAPERTTRMLCDALVGVGYLAKDELGYYQLAPCAEAFLDPEKPTYLGAMVNIFAHPAMWNTLSHVAETVRNGGTLLDRHALTPEHEFWETFAQSTFAFALPGARFMATELENYGLSRSTRILDLACGTGVYGFTAATRLPGATVTCVDWPNVLRYTRGYAERMGLASRIEYRAGDIFKIELGEDYDVIIMANVHHHFPAEDCAQLNRRAKAALKPGGVVAVADFIADDARQTESKALLFALVMMSWTPAGDVYSEREYREMFIQAGFNDVVVRRSPQSPQSVLLARS